MTNVPFPRRFSTLTRPGALGAILFALGCAPESPPADVPPPPEDEDLPVSGDDDDTYDDKGSGGDDDTQSDDDDGSWGDDDDTSWGDDDDAVPGPPSTDQSDEDCGDASAAVQTRFLSADDSNGRSDPNYLRALRDFGGDDFLWTLGRAVRPWEFLNDASWSFTPAAPGAIRIEPRLVELADGTYGLLVAVVPPSPAPAERDPVHLAFAVDTSCSMQGGGLARARDAMHALSSSLQSGDMVSVVRWASNQAVPLAGHAVAGPNDPVLDKVIDELSAGGGTNLEAGLQTAFDVLSFDSSPEHLRRVVLISDGGANVGATSAALIADAAVSGEVEGTYLLGIGVPPAHSYQEALMDEVTDLGRGASIYLQDEDDALRSLAPERFLSLVGTAAREVQLAITLPSGFVIQRFTGEDIAPTPSEVTPQNLVFDQPMLYDLDLVDCSPDAESLDAVLTFTVEWVLPGETAVRVEVLTESVGNLLAAGGGPFWKAQAIVAYAETFGTLRLLPATARGGALDALATQIEAALVLTGPDLDLDFIAEDVATWRAQYE